jgi:hypothetical protein
MMVQASEGRTLPAWPVVTVTGAGASGTYSAVAPPPHLSSQTDSVLLRVAALPDEPEPVSFECRTGTSAQACFFELRTRVNQHYGALQRER